MDYIYTAFHAAKEDGTPVLSPLWYKFPKDAATFGIDTQFFYGPSVLVSPVTEENATAVDVYYPKELFYDFHTVAPTQGAGATVHLADVNYTSIPVSIMGGAVVPLRAQSAMTTAELRKQDFELVVAPSGAGTASGALYVDDGESVKPKSTTEVRFAYKNGKLTVKGAFGHPTGVKVSRVRFANVQAAPKSVKYNGKAVAAGEVAYDAENKVLDVTLGVPFKSGFTVELH